MSVKQLECPVLKQQCSLSPLSVLHRQRTFSNLRQRFLESCLEGRHSQSHTVCRNIVTSYMMTGCLPLSQTVTDQWEYPRKMERHFSITTNWNVSYQFFIPFRISLLGQRTGLLKMERRIPTEISGPPPEVIPNIPFGRKRNGPSI